MRGQHSWWRKGAVALALLLAGQYALTAENEPKVITLSCDGTVTRTTYPIPMSDTSQPVQNMGVVVNLDERTVSFMGYVAPMNYVDTANINFGGQQTGRLFPGFGTATIGGILDRVTGHMTAKATTSGTHTTVVDDYDVLCKVTNRRF
jgi:hypothetical protein